MKKLLSIMLVFTMLLAFVPAGAASADEAVAVSVDTVIAAPADTEVEICIRMASEPHWAAIDLAVAFDPEVLVYKGFRRNPALDAQAAAGETMIYTINTDSAAAGSVGVYFTTAGNSGGYYGYFPDGYDYFGILTFDVAATASVGLSAVSASIDSLTNFEGEDVAFTIADGGVNVVACEHDWQITAHADEDCENAGYTDYECSLCHAMRSVEIPARGHYWNELERVEPTTDAEGHVTYECVWCGKTRTEILSILQPFDGVRVRVEKVTATPGDEYIEMKLYVDDTPRWGSISILLHFDTDVLVYEEFEVNSAVSKQLRTGKPVIFTLNDEKTDEGELRVLLASAYEADGYEGYHSGGYEYLGTIEFDVAATAAPGFSEVTVDVTKLTDNAAVGVPFETVNGGVQVNCAHDWQEIEHSEPACEADGYAIFKCSKCDELKRESLGAALGHSWGDWEVTTPATCSAEGVETRVCSRDASHTETRVLAIDPDAHEWIDGGRTPATCSAEGAAYYFCAHNPEHEKTEPIVIDPDAHDWGEWGVTTPSTCSAEGVETRVCNHDASHTETRPLAVDADAHDWGEWKVTTPATCAAKGVETRVCANDDSHFETREIAIDPDAHVWTQSGMQDATCAAGGWVEYVCENDPTHTRRDETQINPDAHAWGEWGVTTPATCTEKGVETRVCLNDDLHIETREIAMDPDAHAWGEWEVTTPATCTEAAVETRVCANDPAHTETRGGEAAVGHAWGEWQLTVRSTFWQEGEETRYCTRDASHFETRALDKLLKGDIDKDGSITVADALAVLRIAAALVEETQDAIDIADIDRDDEISVADALQILRRSVKLITPEAWLA